MKIFLIGGPGCGKNVIAEHIANKLSIRHINYRSVVKRFLDENKNKANYIKRLIDELKPFPADLAFEVLRDYLEHNGIKDFVLDGYPKSAVEAKKLSAYFKYSEEHITVVIDANKKTISGRLKNRLVCSSCSYLLYDINTDSILDIQCANCHTVLIRRHDDNDKGIADRIDRFVENKEKMISELKKISRIYTVDGSREISAVISDIIEMIFGKNSETLAERGARILIEQLGLNLADPNIVGTPGRLVKTLKELMRGQSREAQDLIRENLSTAFPTHYKGMVILDPIKCVSLCSHHLLPVSYEVIFGYIPEDKSLGFSKIIKVITLLAAKPTLQEDFTQEVIEIFQKVLEPKGLMVIVRGKHSCMMLRGEKSDNTNTTSALRGEFKDDEKTRDEFLSLVRMRDR